MRRRRELKRKYKDSERHDFWELVRSNGVTLLSNDDVEVGVPPQEVRDALRLPRAPTPTPSVLLLSGTTLSTSLYERW